YLELKKRNLLTPYKIKESVLENIPQFCRGNRIIDEDFQWYSVNLVAFGILVNKRVVQLQKLPFPNAVTVLTTPSWREWSGLTDPRRSGSSRFFYELILQRYGWDKGWQMII